MTTSLKIALVVDDENPVAGDLFLENGTIRLTKSLSEEVSQQLWIRFKSFLGEWFLSPSFGFPWFQSVLGVKTPKGIVDQLIRRMILSTPGVASLLDYRSTFTSSSRQLDCQFRCKLTDGATIELTLSPGSSSSDYTPKMSTAWDPQPDTQAGALDRIASVVSTELLDGGAILETMIYTWADPQPITTQNMIDRLAAATYNDVLSGTAIPIGLPFDWYGPGPVTVKNKIDRLAGNLYLLEFGEINIP